MSFKPFTKRVVANQYISASPRKPKPGDDSLVLAIKDELLVSKPSVGAVKALLKSYPGHSIPSTLLTTVFDGLAPPGGNDVEIWQLTLRPEVDIFAVTDYLHSAPALKGQERNISPNHVLIPASNGDQCPFGAPSQLVGTPPAIPPATPFAGGQFQPVVVVDSGYQWAGGKWGQNPLDIRGHLAPHQAEYYKLQAGAPPQPVWDPFAPDVLSAVRPNVLDHLAGHANFVAGLVAQRCPEAEITVWNHNGAFVELDRYSLPTEAVVLHSLASITQGPTIPHVPLVINFGFAFASHLGKLPSEMRGVHIAWEDTLQPIFNLGGVVVAPAGNQSGSTIPRYPAALPNVIGVASHDAPVGTAPAKPSSFTNVGSWVTCSANGRNVVSTFLHVKMRVEEGSPLKKPDFTSNWARWNGTCFAAPKVAAAIAKRANGVTPAQAWEALKLAHANQKDPNQMLGIIFTDQDLL